MLEYIVFGEFDINLGNVIAIEYPSKTGINELTLSSYLIPEGTHNFTSDNFCFIVNRKLNSEELISNNLKGMVEKMNVNKIKYLDFKDIQGFKTYYSKVIKLKEMYNFNNYSMNWDLVKLTEKDSGIPSPICLKIIEDDKEKFYNFVIYHPKTNEVYFKIPIHQDIQFKKLNTNFASIYTLNSQAIGFNFEKEEELSDLEKILDHEPDGSPKNEELSNTFNLEANLNTENEIYFLCGLETKIDKTVKRGAIMKSIAIGTTKLVNLFVFKTLVRYLLDEVFKISASTPKVEERNQKVKKIFEQAYKAFNNIHPKYFHMNQYTRGLKSFLASDESIYFDDKIKYVDIELNGVKIKVDLTLLDNEEKIFPCSLKNFCLTFKENTMSIFDAILNDKKILFIGDNNTSCEKLSNFTFACLNLVCPPCLGILKRINPYKNLYDLDFLKAPNVIYGVTNPIFKSKLDYWDILCEVDTGKVTLSENYKKQHQLVNKDSDQFFIKEILYKINNEFISNYELCKYFRIYTNHLLNITGEQYFSDDIDLMNEINKQWQRKLKLQNSSLWKLEKDLIKIRETINYSGRTYKLIYNHIDNIYKRKFIDKEELIMIFNDIDKFLVNDYFISLFLYVLTNFTVDYQVFFNALFSKYHEMENIMRSIIKKIRDNAFGSQLIRRLNFMYQIRINGIEIKEVKTVD